MESTVINITPPMASNWLESNTINRPLRPSVVEGLVMAFTRNEYRLTHQGIAFSTTGELLDGQHRLTAISKMPAGFSIPIMVTRGLPMDASKGMDQGLKRTHADVLVIPTRMAAAARYLARHHQTSNRGISSQFLIPFVEGIRKPYMDLHGFCSKTSKVWSGAAINAAAILCMLNDGDEDYIKMTYYALNHAEFDSMSPAAQSLFRQSITGSANMATADMFCRALKVFDVKQAKTTNLRITDTAASLNFAREVITRKVLGRSGMKKAPRPETAGPKKATAKSTAKA